jgi:HSP20 family molecular chaperone IbpA
MSVSGFNDFFSTPFLTDVSATPFLSSIQRDSEMILHRSSPGYEVTENADNFQLSMSIPGLGVQDVDVTLEHGGRVLNVRGGRKIKQTLADGTITSSESKFEKRFIMDHNIDATKVKASLNDGILQVVAPKVKIIENAVRKIPISEGPSHGLLTQNGEREPV